MQSKRRGIQLASGLNIDLRRQPPTQGEIDAQLNKLAEEHKQTKRHALVIGVMGATTVSAATVTAGKALGDDWLLIGCLFALLMAEMFRFLGIHKVSPMSRLVYETRSELLAPISKADEAEALFLCGTDEVTVAYHRAVVAQGRQLTNEEVDEMAVWWRAVTERRQLQAGGMAKEMIKDHRPAPDFTAAVG